MSALSAAGIDTGLVMDVLWSVCLGVMTGLSLRTWRRVGSEAMVPLQWGADGRPVMRAQRSLAVGFTPMVAMAGGLMLAAAERMADTAEPAWMGVRLVAPLLLVVVHRSHMGHALATLKAEGGLKR